MENLDLKINSIKELNELLYSFSKIISVAHERQKKLFQDLSIKVHELTPFGFSIEWSQIAERNDVKELMNEIAKDRDLLLLNEVKLFKTRHQKKKS